MFGLHQEKHQTLGSRAKRLSTVKQLVEKSGVERRGDGVSAAAGTGAGVRLKPLASADKQGSNPRPISATQKKTTSDKFSEAAASGGKQKRPVSANPTVGRTKTKSESAAAAMDVSIQNQAEAIVQGYVDLCQELKMNCDDDLMNAALGFSQSGDSTALEYVAELCGAGQVHLQLAKKASTALDSVDIAHKKLISEFHETGQELVSRQAAANAGSRQRAPLEKLLRARILDAIATFRGSIIKALLRLQVLQQSSDRICDEVTVPAMFASLDRGGSRRSSVVSEGSAGAAGPFGLAVRGLTRSCFSRASERISRVLRQLKSQHLHNSLVPEFSSLAATPFLLPPADYAHLESKVHLSSPGMTFALTPALLASASPAVGVSEMNSSGLDAAAPLIPTANVIASQQLSSASANTSHHPISPGRATSSSSPARQQAGALRGADVVGAVRVWMTLAASSSAVDTVPLPTTLAERYVPIDYDTTADKNELLRDAPGRTAAGHIPSGRVYSVDEHLEVVCRPEVLIDGQMTFEGETGEGYEFEPGPAFPDDGTPVDAEGETARQSPLENTVSETATFPSEGNDGDPIGTSPATLMVPMASGNRSVSGSSLENTVNTMSSPPPGALSRTESSSSLYSTSCASPTARRIQQSPSVSPRGSTSSLGGTKRVQSFRKKIVKRREISVKDVGYTRFCRRSIAGVSSSKQQLRIVRRAAASCIQYVLLHNVIAKRHARVADRVICANEEREREEIFALFSAATAKLEAEERRKMELASVVLARAWRQHFAKLKNANVCAKWRQDRDYSRSVKMIEKWWITLPARKASTSLHFWGIRQRVLRRTQLLAAGRGFSAGVHTIQRVMRGVMLRRGFKVQLKEFDWNLKCNLVRPLVQSIVATRATEVARVEREFHSEARMQQEWQEVGVTRMQSVVRGHLARVLYRKLLHHQSMNAALRYHRIANKLQRWAKRQLALKRSRAARSGLASWRQESINSELRVACASRIINFLRMAVIRNRYIDHLAEIDRRNLVKQTARCRSVKDRFRSLSQGGHFNDSRLDELCAQIPVSHFSEVANTQVMSSVVRRNHKLNSVAVPQLKLGSSTPSDPSAPPADETVLARMERVMRQAPHELVHALRVLFSTSKQLREACIALSPEEPEPSVGSGNNSAVLFDTAALEEPAEETSHYVAKILPPSSPQKGRQRRRRSSSHPRMLQVRKNPPLPHLRHVKIPVTVKQCPRPYQTFGAASTLAGLIAEAAANHAHRLIFSRTAFDDIKQQSLEPEEQMARAQRVDARRHSILSCYGVDSEAAWLQQVRENIDFLADLNYPQGVDDEEDAHSQYSFVYHFVCESFPNVRQLADVPLHALVFALQNLVRVACGGCSLTDDAMELVTNTPASGKLPVLPLTGQTIVDYLVSIAPEELEIAQDPHPQPQRGDDEEEAEAHDDSNSGDERDLDHSQRLSALGSALVRLLVGVELSSSPIDNAMEAPDENDEGTDEDDDEPLPVLRPDDDARSDVTAEFNASAEGAPLHVGRYPTGDSGDDDDEQQQYDTHESVDGSVFHRPESRISNDPHQLSPFPMVDSIMQSSEMGDETN